MAASGVPVLGTGILLPGTRELESSSAEGLLHAVWSPSDIQWDCKAIKAIPAKGSVGGDAALSPSRISSEPAGGKGPAVCRVEDCHARLSEEKVYYKRYLICPYHASLASITIDGRACRWCQQCGRFQLLSEFDDEKRTCRHRLEMHNARRRKRPVKRNRGESKKVGEEEGLPSSSPVKRAGVSSRSGVVSADQVSRSGTSSSGEGESTSESTGRTEGHQISAAPPVLMLDSWEAPMRLDDSDLLLDTTVHGLGLPNVPSFATLTLDPGKKESEVLASGQDLADAFDDIFGPLDDGGVSGAGEEQQQFGGSAASEQQQMQQQTLRIDIGTSKQSANVAQKDQFAGLMSMDGDTTPSSLAPTHIQAPCAFGQDQVEDVQTPDVLAGSGPRHSFFYPPGSEPVPFEVPQGWPAPSFPLPITSNQLAMPLHQLPPISRLLRMSLKLYGVNPAALPAELQEQLVGMLSCSPEELEGFIRPGCVHLVLDAPPVRTSTNGIMNGEDDAHEYECAIRAALEASPALRALPLLVVQLGDVLALAKAGRLVGLLDMKQGEAAGVVPMIDRISPLAVLSVCHEGVEAQEEGTSEEEEGRPRRNGGSSRAAATTVHLGGRFLAGNNRTMLARQPDVGRGTFLTVEVLQSSEVNHHNGSGVSSSTVALRVPHAVPGLLILECQRGVFMSDPKRVAVSDDAAIVREVRQLSSVAQGPRIAMALKRLGLPSVEDLILGIGTAVGVRDSWLRAQHRSPRTGSPRQSWEYTSLSYAVPSEHEMRQLAGSANATRLLSASWWSLIGRCLLMAIVQDWPAVLGAMLGALRLAFALTGQPEGRKHDDDVQPGRLAAAEVVAVVDALIPGGDGRGVLVLAQRARARRVEAALRDWAAQRQVYWAEGGQPGGRLVPEEEEGAPVTEREVGSQVGTAAVVPTAAAEQAPAEQTSKTGGLSEPVSKQEELGQASGEKAQLLSEKSRKTATKKAAAIGEELEAAAASTKGGQSDPMARALAQSLRGSLGEARWEVENLLGEYELRAARRQCFLWDWMFRP